MLTNSILSNIKLIISEIIHKLNYTSNLKDGDLEDDILYALRKDGYYVYPNFLSSEKCKELRLKADDFILRNPNKVKIESNGCDIRVYGVDRYSNDFNIEKLFKFSYHLFSKFSWTKKPGHFLLLGKIISNEMNLGSGGGWHRDSPIKHQFKTLLYLSDVSLRNGPFQYIKGSHHYKSIKRLSKHLKIDIRESRFQNEEIEFAVQDGVISEPISFTGNAGTLLIVDTRGLHRGMPLVADDRYALTNYHFENGVNKKFFQ